MYRVIFVVLYYSVDFAANCHSLFQVNLVVAWELDLRLHDAVMSNCHILFQANLVVAWELDLRLHDAVVCCRHKGTTYHILLEYPSEPSSNPKVSEVA